MTKRQLIDWMMINNLLEASNEPLVLKPTKRNHDELGWRCFKSGCLKYITWILIRKHSFFQATVADLKQLLYAMKFSN